MKRLFIILTIFISSFFFCSYYVSADTYEYTFNESDFNYINNDFFRIRELAINFINNNENYTDYFIYYDLNDNIYKVLFINDLKTTTRIDSNSVNFLLRVIGTTIHRYTLLNNELELSNSNNLYSLTLTISKENNIIPMNNYLDSSFDIKVDSSDIFNFSYKNYNISIDNSKSFPSLYNIYLALENDLEPDIHAQEKEVITNFYTLSINKIIYLTNVITSNYIYLSIIGVLIFIFIIELIFRRYL